MKDISLTHSYTTEREAIISENSYEKDKKSLKSGVSVIRGMIPSEFLKYTGENPSLKEDACTE